MKNTSNVFIKSLVDEILAKSRVDAKCAYQHVQDFSKTKEFAESYRKWRIIQMRALNSPNYNPVTPIGLIVSRLFNRVNRVPKGL